MIPAKFDKDDVKIIKDESIFRGFFKLSRYLLKHKLFGGGWSPELEREIFLKHEAAAAIVYDPIHDLIGLVEQFRVGMVGSENHSSPWSLEGVAGMVEAGESPEELLRRELLEEAGITHAELIHITSMYPSPGSSNEYIHCYCALSDLSKAGGLFGLAHEGEDICFHVLPAEQVLGAMLQSRANNGATLIGLMWLKEQRPRMRAESQKE